MTQHSRRHMRARRGAAPAFTVLVSFFKVAGPLILIGGFALWFLNRGSGLGRFHVSTSVPGAEILVDGVQTGYMTDTTLTATVGRRIVTVRKEGLVSDPDFAVVEVRRDVIARVSFDLHPPRPVSRSDSIPPLRRVRQEIFSTGEPVRALPPVPQRQRPLVDFAPPADRVPALGGYSTSGAPVSPTPTTSLDTVPLPVSLQGTKVTVTSDPSGAEIWVNGAPSPRVTPYTFYGLDRGLYSLKVRRDGYTARPDSVLLALSHDYQAELASFDLHPDSTVAQPTLTVATEPLAAAIRIDGRAAGVGNVSLQLAFGTHRVEFGDAPGYKTPPPVTVTLSSDKPNAEVSGVYERLAGNGYIAVRPGDDFGKFNGSELRVYVDNELILDGPQQRYDAALIGRVLSGKRLVRVQYGDLTGDLHVTALDGEVVEITMRIESFFSKRKLRLRERTHVPLDEWQQRSRRLTVLTFT